MHYTEEEMELMNEYESLRSREAERDLCHQKRLTQWEQNALECSTEFVNEEMGSLRAERGR